MTLGQVSRALKCFAEQTVFGQVNIALPNGQISSAQARFVGRCDHEGIDRIVQTDVGQDEVLVGLDGDDTRLRDAVLAVIG